jgi:hypothetical protein
MGRLILTGFALATFVGCAGHIFLPLLWMMGSDGDAGPVEEPDAAPWVAPAAPTGPLPYPPCDSAPQAYPCAEVRP